MPVELAFSTPRPLPQSQIRRFDMDNWEEQKKKDIEFVDKLTFVLASAASCYIVFYFIPMVIHKIFF